MGTSLHKLPQITCRPTPRRCPCLLERDAPLPFSPCTTKHALYSPAALVVKTNCPLDRALTSCRTAPWGSSTWWDTVHGFTVQRKQFMHECTPLVPHLQVKLLIDVLVVFMKCVPVSHHYHIAVDLLIYTFVLTQHVELERESRAERRQQQRCTQQSVRRLHTSRCTRSLRSDRSIDPIPCTTYNFHPIWASGTSDQVIKALQDATVWDGPISRRDVSATTANLAGKSCRNDISLRSVSVDKDHCKKHCIINRELSRPWGQCRAAWTLLVVGGH